MKSLFRGIDPGQHGGVATIDEEKNIISINSTPFNGEEYSYEQMLLLVQQSTGIYYVYFILEKPVAFPNQNSVATLNTGIGFGLWRMAVGISLGVIKEVRPNEWTKEIIPKSDTKLTYNERKKRNAHLAKQLFPDWNPKLKGDIFAQADALLLAEYGRRIFTSPDDHFNEVIRKPTKISRTKGKSSNFFITGE